MANSISAGGASRMLNAKEDFPDLRDRYYEPPLIELPSALNPPPHLLILDQGSEGACTGFATAAALNLLRYRQTCALPNESASPRMLYEMAKLHDEWEGTGYEGSSIRGAIKGFFHNGVCREQTAPYVPGQQNWSLTVEQAKEARGVILGAYYRLRPILVDYHAALQQTGAIVVSANVHRGWSSPDKDGRIVYSTFDRGGHAFVIVGYDADGFLVQNSWGPAWGRFGGAPGIAHWNYHDWSETVIDAWVMRLAVPTPTAFELTHRAPRRAGTQLPENSKHSPRRQDVIGHIVHLDDGRLIETGTYGTPLESIKETARLLREGAEEKDRKYDHLVFYAHGGVTDATAAARHASATRDGFKRNGIYPIHFLWETGLIEELYDIVVGKITDRGGIVGGFEDWTDLLIEKLTAGIGRALWREMKTDAERAFARGAQSTEAVRVLLGVNDGLKKPLKIHIVGHSAGSNFSGEFLRAWPRLAPAKVAAENCFVLAAACTVAQYERDMLKALNDGNLGHLTIYNLSRQRELDDSVGPYRKSLLYLVSNAFEEAQKMPLLGMQDFADALAGHRKQTLVYTSGQGTRRTNATSHGGYGADLTTLNDILKVVLGQKYDATKAFRPEELAAA